MKWINTVEAATEVEQAGTKGQWRIGDAVIKDMKENSLDFDGQSEIKEQVFTDCSKALAEKGIESSRGGAYSNTAVRHLFEAAFNFPRDERNPKISWECHRVAGTPANLKKAIAALRKIEKSISHYNVRNIISHWQEEADAERQKELAKAKAKKAVAKAKKAKASEDKLATKDKAEREAAEKRRQEAKREIDEANRLIKESGAPKINTDLDVDTSDVGALERWAVYMGVTAHTMAMKREAQKTLKELSKIAHLLSANEQQTIADRCIEIIDILEEISGVVKRPRKLASIQGGRS